MDLLDILTKLWPIFITLIALVVVLAKAENRISALEDKVKTLFDFIIKKR